MIDKERGRVDARIFWAIEVETLIEGTLEEARCASHYFVLVDDEPTLQKEFHLKHTHTHWGDDEVMPNIQCENA